MFKLLYKFSFYKKRILKSTLWNILADDLYHHSNWSYIYFNDLFVNGKSPVSNKWLKETISEFPDYCMRLYNIEIDSDVIRVVRNNESATLNDIDEKKIKKWSKGLYKYYKKNYKSKEGWKKLTVSDWPFKELDLLDNNSISNFIFNNTKLVSMAHDKVVLILGVK